MDIRSILAKANKNRILEVELATFSVLAANTWVTLVAPIIMGVSIGRLIPDFKASSPELIIYAIAVLIHIVCMKIIFTSSTRNSLSLEVDDIVKKYEELKNEELPQSIEHSFLRKLQLMTCYLSTLELEQCFDEANHSSSLNKNELAELAKNHFDRILRPLVNNREDLFGYQSGSLYNMALYIHFEKDDELGIVWRDCDDRIQKSNRSWKPGFGHVGLTFIHNEMKICPDIKSSSELSNSSTTSDSKQYRSFLSIPINNCTDHDTEINSTGNKPHGVLVLTSAHTDQFSLERDQFLVLTIAKLISIYMDKYLSTMQQVQKLEPDHD